MMKMDFYSRGLCVYVCTSFQMRCPSAYQPVGSLGTARHFAAKQQTVTGLFFPFSHQTSSLVLFTTRLAGEKRRHFFVGEKKKPYECVLFKLQLNFPSDCYCASTVN